MDIGVPYKVLGPVNVKELAAYVDGLPDEDWERNRFRQDLLASRVHSEFTRAIPLIHNFVPYQMPWKRRSMKELFLEWCKQEGVDPDPLMPEVIAENDQGEVSAFPQWKQFEPLIAPILEKAISYIKTPKGVLTRVAIVEMAPGGNVGAHIDGQPMAARAHRLHVPLLSPVGVEYKIDGKKLKMQVGKVYDFNNRKNHAVKNKAKRRRINILIDYLPDPGPAIQHALPPT